MLQYLNLKKNPAPEIRQTYEEFKQALNEPSSPRLNKINEVYSIQMNLNEKFEILCKAHDNKHRNIVFMQTVIMKLGWSSTCVLYVEALKHSRLEIAEYLSKNFSLEMSLMEEQELLWNELKKDNVDHDFVLCAFDTMSEQAALALVKMLCLKGNDELVIKIKKLKGSSLAPSILCKIIQYALEKEFVDQLYTDAYTCRSPNLN